MLSYFFYPNPGNSGYDHPKVIFLLVFCSLLFLVSFAVSFWRKKRENPVTRKLARSWPSALRWFGALGLLLTIARAEEIQFLSMRFLWVLWALALLVYLILQVRLFRLKHYTVLPRDFVEDPREKYLPKRG